MRNVRLLKVTIVMLIFVGLAACDSGPGVDPGEPPQIPQISQQLEINLDYFQNNNAAANRVEAAKENFSRASLLILSTHALVALGSSIGEFLNSIRESADANFENGMWKWTLSRSVNEISLTVELRADKNNSGGYAWGLFYTTEGTDNDLDNYKLIGGNTSADGAQGSWEFYNFVEQNSTAVFAFNYSISGENAKQLSATIYDVTENNEDATLEYTLNGDENDYIWASGNSNFTVHWNTATMTGYIINLEGVKLCWNAEFQDVPCG